MNARERFYETTHFGNPDRFCYYEWHGYWPDTIARWHGEGLEEGVDMDAILKMVPDILLFGHKAYPMGEELEERFGFDRRGSLGLNLGPIPQFLTRTIKEEGPYRVWVDYLGVTNRAIKDRYHMPEYLDFPVKTREDFKNFKVRYDPCDMRRFPLTWGEELFASLRDRDYPIGTGFDGFFGKPMQIIGLEKLLYACHDQPMLIHDINDFWLNFLIEVFSSVLEHVDIDWVQMEEDCAYKNHMLISPKHFREFVLPYYRRIVDFFHRHGVDTVYVGSDGDMDKLIELSLEAGVDGFDPLEVAAGNDAVALREKYGKVVLNGNIDKRALMGDKEDIRNEVLPKLTYFQGKGGYIPSIDHRVSPDIPLDNYLYYLQLVKSFD